MDNDALYRELGQAISSRRKKLGLKQVDLAARIGLSRASVANIEVGRQKVLLHQVYALAEALELDGVELLLPAQVRARTQSHAIAIQVGAEGMRRPRQLAANRQASGGLTPQQRAQIEHLFDKATPTRRKRSED